MGHGNLAPLQKFKQAQEANFEFLEEEFKSALRNNPHEIICTPGFAKTSMSVADVIFDHFSGQSGESDSIELLQILAAVSEQTDAIGNRAAALIARMARNHANFHQGDMQ